MKLIVLLLILVLIVMGVMGMRYFNGMGKAVVEKCVYPERQRIMGHDYQYWQGRGHNQPSHRWRGDAGSP